MDTKRIGDRKSHILLLSGIMRIGTILLLFIGLNCQGQIELTDLECSSHSVTFEGNEELLFRLTEPLRTTFPNILSERNEICEELIKEIGSTANPEFLIVHISSSIGISCRGTFKTLVFSNENLAGYWYSDTLFPKSVDGTTLLWSTEGGYELSTDISVEIPDFIEPMVGVSLTFVSID